MNKVQKLLVLPVLLLALSACGSSKRNIAMSVQSDPLGAYALMQVKYKGNKESDWIFLGPTPVVIDKPVRFNGATSVSLKVIRPGFFEQTKTWSAKEFKRQHSRNKKIMWVPTLVKQ